MLPLATTSLMHLYSTVPGLNDASQKNINSRNTYKTHNYMHSYRQAHTNLHKTYVSKYIIITHKHNYAHTCTCTCMHKYTYSKYICHQILRPSLLRQSVL